jgi:hypothetical protein
MTVKSEMAPPRVEMGSSQRGVGTSSANARTTARPDRSEMRTAETTSHASAAETASDVTAAEAASHMATAKTTPHVTAAETAAVPAPTAMTATTTARVRGANTETRAQDRTRCKDEREPTNIQLCHWIPHSALSRAHARLFGA